MDTETPDFDNMSNAEIDQHMVARIREVDGPAPTQTFAEARALFIQDCLRWGREDGVTLTPLHLGILERRMVRSGGIDEATARRIYKKLTAPNAKRRRAAGGSRGR